MKGIDRHIANKRIERNCYPGEQWLYIKIYGGLTTCDQLLVEVIYPAIEGLIRSKVIVDWFFIRYYDPDFHLRIRLELSSKDKMMMALNAMNRHLLPLCRHRRLNKVIIDTYERELERYGKKSMVITERLFCLDSHCICQLLTHLLHKGKGSERWRLAFLWVDTVLDALGFDLNQKMGLIKKMSEAYLAEFGYNEHNIKPLARRYRHLRDEITQILQYHTVDSESIDVIRIHCAKIKKNLNIVDAKQLNVSSLLHMSMNRLFVSQNRLNELVLYYCLERYYRKEVKTQRKD